MIFRLLIVIALIALAFFLIRRLRLRLRLHQDKKNKPRQLHPFEETVSCKQCGLRLPKSEAIEENGAFYCNKEHAEK